VILLAPEATVPILEAELEVGSARRLRLNYAAAGRNAWDRPQRVVGRGSGVRESDALVADALDLRQRKPPRVFNGKAVIELIEQEKHNSVR